MTEQLDLASSRPPEAPIEMPYQVLERQPRPDQRTWLALLMQIVARRAPHE